MDKAKSPVGSYDDDLRIPNIRLKPIAEAEADAAVAIILKPALEDLEVLLVRRALNPSDPWSGDIAFPGGRRRGREPLIETAVREAWEEIGVDLNLCEALGTLDIYTSTRVPDLRVLPFVYLCDRELEIRLNEELSSYFWIPLRRLRSSRGHAIIEGAENPAFILEEGVVWGLTYRMLEDLLGRVEESA